ncbi:hypothetical protein ROLI_013600 [Roseobacter fucihabitans]|uniref:CHAT domain-containing protein n=1 Tax=Roseobacter fucihabitans TaxID=1537242 RepID=A0ABZ2BSV0_9RHOB|nr:CHAT domain-containing protein [Roseobacter litoralis]MBC6967017.1 CHAT domain protein [Roseobacter litoralis]
MALSVLPGELVYSASSDTLPEPLDDLIHVTGVVETRVDQPSARGVSSARTDVADLDDDDIVEIRLEGGLKLWQSVADTRTDFASGERSIIDQALLVPRTLRLGDGPRTWDWAGYAVEGVKVLKLEVTGGAGELTAYTVARHIEGKLDLGLHRCTLDDSGLHPRIVLSPPDFGAVDAAEPMLVLVHGTFSSTVGSFGDLAEGSEDQPDLWSFLQSAFPGGIYALEHRTVTESPLQNAIDLVESLPKGARVSLLSHSRGGLVAELLARGARFDLETGAPVEGPPYDDTDREILIAAGEKTDLLDRLDAALRDCAMVVERVIRIGGPLGGTTLASRRLDRALSIALNALELVPALRASVGYSLLKAYLLGFVKAKESRLPGLEAMMPQSALIKLVNRPDALSSGTLHVIAGDNEGRGMFQRLRNLAIDLFFESDNDFVVNTPSMTLGLRRSTLPVVKQITSAEITHFGYFRDKEGRRAIRTAAQELPVAEGAGESLWVEAVPRGIAVSRARHAGTLPVCFFLPGVMGTHLDHKGKWIWSNPVRMATGGLRRLRMPGSDVTPDVMMDRYYGNLARFLSRSHDTILFPYDWRLDVRETANRLAAEVRAALAQTDKPIRFLAHSMGGLVVRAFIDAHPALWAEIRRRPGSRFVMLGTPNGGAFSMVHTLMGRAKSIRQLELLDVTQSMVELLGTITSMPGPAQLLPSDAGGHYLKRETWVDLHRLHGDDWVVPPEVVFADARAAHAIFASQRLDPDVVCYVAGVGQELTRSRIRVDQTAKGQDRVVFLGTPEGDGTVTWETGIPSGVKPYFMDAIHGDLARTKPAFPALVELLATGRTSALSRTKPVRTRRELEDTAALHDAQIEVFPRGEDVLDSFIGADAPKGTEADAPARKTTITMRHGDLRFSQSPVLVGHYHGDAIDGAEAALDGCLDNAMTEVRELNLYPGKLETCEVILRDDCIPKGAVIAGLDQFGELTPGKLLVTINRAVLRYVLTLRRRAVESGSRIEEMEPIQLTTLIIGHKGANMTVQQSVQAILEAVADANLTLDATPVAHIEFVEMFEDTAYRAASAIDSACRTGPLSEAFTFDRRITAGDGAMLRMDYGLEISDWQRISATHAKDRDALEFTVIANGAKATFNHADVDMTVIDKLLKESREGTATNRDLGRLLFQLMVPLDLKAFAQNDQKIQLIVDGSTAKYPWELMEDAVSVFGEGLYQSLGSKEFRPLVVRTPVLRQLVSSGRVVPRVRGRKALVVGDPENTGLSQLDGARAEANLVVDLLEGSGQFEVTPLVGTRDAVEVHTHVMRSEYKIMHFATHGVFEAKEGAVKAGLVLSDGINLTSASLKGMEATPEFVFLNCCHLGRIDEKHDDNGPIAADLSRTLIDKGVRAVIAAGWAVDDKAAELFAKEFYESMFASNRFGDAVFYARRAVFDTYPDTNTWGAYQCYGDPNYQFNEGREEDAGSRKGRTFYSADHAQKAAINIARDVNSPHRSRDDLIAELDELMDSSDPGWRGNARWCEAMGQAYGRLNVFAPAIELLEDARANSGSHVSIYTLELLEVLKVHAATDDWLSADVAVKTAPKDERDVARERSEALREALKETTVAALKTLARYDVALGDKTERREKLKGSICKRKAMCYRPGATRQNALKEMISYYRAAQEIAAEGRPDRLKPNPTFNLLVGHIALGLADVDGQSFETLFDRLLAENRSDETRRPKFWTAALPAEVDMLRGLLAGPEAQDALFVRIDQTYRKAWMRGGAHGDSRAIRKNIEFLKVVLRHEAQVAWLTRVDALIAEITAG